MTTEQSERSYDQGEGDAPQPLEIVSSDGEVLLRQYTPDDAAEAFALIDRNRDHLSHFGDTTAEKYQTVEDMLRSITHPSNPDRLRFGIRNKAGEYVGSINLTPDQDNRTRGEIGYYLGREFTGQKITERAVEALAAAAFSQLGYNELYGEVAEGNIASQKVLQKARFTPVGVHDGKVTLTLHKPTDVQG